MLWSYCKNLSIILSPNDYKVRPSQASKYFVFNYSKLILFFKCHFLGGISWELFWHRHWVPSVTMYPWLNLNQNDFVTLISWLLTIHKIYFEYYWNLSMKLATAIPGKERQCRIWIKKKVTYNLTLTIPLAHGKNIPRVKTPRTGPPTMPKILKAAWSWNL